MNKIKYSIITAYVNEVELTKRFLVNIEDKLPENSEVILINSGNKNKIKHVFDKQTFRRIDMNKNNSFSHSMNKGIKAAKGEYIIIIGNDSFPTDDNWVTKLEDCFDNKNCMIATCNNSNPGKKTLRDKVYKVKDNFEFYYYFPAICWMLSKKTIEKIGLFDENFKIGGYEDNDYCTRVAIGGGEIILNTNIYLLIHKCSSESNSLLNEKIKQSNLNYFINKYMEE